MAPRQVGVFRELMVHSVASINIYNHVLTAVSLVVSPSTLLQRSSIDDHRRAASRQGGDVDGRPADCSPCRSAGDTGHAARRCRPADPCLGFADDDSAGESAINPTLFHLNCLSNYLYAILPNNLSLQGRHHRHGYTHRGFLYRSLPAALPTAALPAVADAVDLVFEHHRL